MTLEYIIECLQALESHPDIPFPFNTSEQVTSKTVHPAVSQENWRLMKEACRQVLLTDTGAPNGPAMTQLRKHGFGVCKQRGKWWIQTSKGYVHFAEAPEYQY